MDLSDCPNLTELNCSSNQLTLLEVSKCKNLFKLLCYDNQLTSLNVSQNPKLCILDCGKNQLISLDISKTLIGEVVANYWQLACAMNTLETLYLKTGWQIKYINVNRDSKYISNQTQILYKD
jgi:surface antigen